MKKILAFFKIECYNMRIKRDSVLLEAIMESWKTNKEPELFDLVEFVDKVKISDKNLYHLESTNENFEEYLKLLGKYSDYDSYTMIYYWLDQARKEFISSGEIEQHRFSFSNQELLNGNLFFDNLNISEKRIKDIHKFVCEHSNTGNNNIGGEYRNKSCWVGKFNIDGTPDVYWCGANVEDIHQFMKNYIEFYKKSSLREIYYNPFLKSALAQMLFIKIHPFADANGRTSRIIHNVSFTSNINKIYGTKLKLSPLNISENIYINRLTFVSMLNHIKFDI